MNADPTTRRTHAPHLAAWMLLALSSCASQVVPPRAPAAGEDHLVCEQLQRDVVAAQERMDHQRVLELVERIHKRSCFDETANFVWLHTSLGQAYAGLDRHVDVVIETSFLIGSPYGRWDGFWARTTRAAALLAIAEGQPPAEQVPTYRRALRDLRAARDMGAEPPEQVVQRAVLLRTLGRPEAAAVALREVGDLDCSCGAADGVEHASLCARPVALEAARLAAELDDASRSREAARALAARDPVAGAAALSEHLERYPWDNDAHTLRAVVLAGLSLESGASAQAFEAVLRECDHVLLVDPAATDVLLSRAVALDRLGRREPAAAAYRTYLDRVARDVDPQNHAAAEARLEELAEALAVEALPDLRARVEAGDAEAMRELGDLYREGRGVERDPRRAFELYLGSAEAGWGPGMVAAGACLQEGLGTEVDREAAERWYTRSMSAKGGAAADGYYGFYVLRSAEPAPTHMPSLHLVFGEGQGPGEADEEAEDEYAEHLAAWEARMREAEESLMAAASKSSSAAFEALMTSALESDPVEALKWGYFGQAARDDAEWFRASPALDERVAELRATLSPKQLDAAERRAFENWGHYGVDPESIRLPKRAPREE
jgi:TPR repeat protein